MRRHGITIDPATLQFLLDALPDHIESIEEEFRADVAETLKQVLLVWSDNQAMAGATVVYEDDEVQVLEDPKGGDEKSLWIWSKTWNFLDIDTGFFDTDDVEELKTHMKAIVILGAAMY